MLDIIVTQKKIKGGASKQQCTQAATLFGVAIVEQQRNQVDSFGFYCTGVMELF